MIRPQRAIWVGLLVVAAGCSSGATSATTTQVQPQTVDAAVTAEGLLETLPPVAVEAAEVSVKADDPSDCLLLAENGALLTLPSLVIALANADPSVEAVNGLEDAVTALDSLAGSVDDAALAEALTVAAPTLEPLRRFSSMSEVELDALETSLQALGEITDGLCGFPLDP